MPEDQPSYLSYLIRLWQVKRRGQPNWQASLESPITGQRQGFPNLAALFAFITAQTCPPFDRANADPLQARDDASELE
ncbi:MAG TPA: hypothetical protein VJG32_05880 [Anaerolineae bacterium]|nr:hypothetical protein [Anaerolineae bacterium]